MALLVVLSISCRYFCGCVAEMELLGSGGVGKVQVWLPAF